MEYGLGVMGFGLWVRIMVRVRARVVDYGLCRY